MTDTEGALGIDIDLREDYLEESLVGDCKCESKHTRIPPCSIEVTHRFFACLYPHGANVCAVVAESVKSRTGRCTSCGDPTADCWRVIPV